MSNEIRIARRLRPIRLLLWLFFWLLLVEGALRKWVLPGLADPLLIIRDPVLILIYLLALSAGVFPVNSLVVASGVLATICFALALVAGHGNLFVALYGVRTNFLFVPLVLLMPRVFDREDVLKIGRWVLWLSIPMVALVALQFLSPSSSFVNRSVAGGMNLFSGAAGRFRPMGTFSFTSGVASYFTLAAAFFLVFAQLRGRMHLAVHLACGAAVIAAIPVSISRTLAMSCAVVLSVSWAALISTGQARGRIVQVAAIIGMSAFIAQFLPFFEEGTEAFRSRWDSAAQSAGGVKEAIVDRAVGDFTGPLEALWEVPMLGDGAGLGTNVGARLATGRMGFLMGEGEWYRLLGELGPLFGLANIALRVAVVFLLFSTAWRSLQRRNPVPFILFTAVALWVLNGQWGQPTTLGFATFGAGLCLAANRLPANPTAPVNDPRSTRR